MTNKYIITQHELDQLEEARLKLIELCDGDSPLHTMLFSCVQPVTGTLWKIVNVKRESVEN